MDDLGPFIFLGNNKVDSGEHLIIPPPVVEKGFFREDAPIRWSLEEQEKIRCVIRPPTGSLPSEISYENIGSISRPGEEDNPRRRQAPKPFFADSKQEKPVSEDAQFSEGGLRHFVTTPDKAVYGIIYLLKKEELIRDVGSFENWLDTRDNWETIKEYRESIPRILVPEMIPPGDQSSEGVDGFVLNRRTALLAVAGLLGAGSVAGFLASNAFDTDLPVDPPSMPGPDLPWVTDFEDGRMDGWWPVELPEAARDRDGNYWKVTSEGHISGTYSLQLYSEGLYDDNCIATDDFVIDMNTDFSISFKWWTPDHNNSGPVVNLLKKEGVNFQKQTREEIYPDNGISLRFGPDAINEEGIPFDNRVRFGDEEYHQPSLDTRKVHQTEIKKNGDTATLLLNGEELATDTITTEGKYRLGIAGEGTYGNPSLIIFDDIILSPINQS
jgi:hypothetical protein